MKKDPKIKGYLITESAVETNNPEIIHDSKSGSTAISAILQEGDIPNRNKRIYSTEVLKKAIQSPYIQERLKTKSFYGEAGHPLQPDMERQLYIDQTRISHIVTKIWFDGNKMKGIIESANTAVGKDFQGLIRQGSSVAFSMRGVGPITEKKGEYLEIKEPLSIFCYDWVIHPSHSVAYMEKVLSESTLNMLLGKDQFDLSKSDHAVLQESANIFNEGMILPLYQETIRDYVKTNSRNFRNITEQFEIDRDNANIKVNEDLRTVDVQQGHEIIRVFLEDYITQEIDDYLISKF